MNRKITTVTIALLAALGLAACGSPKAQAGAEPVTYHMDYPAYDNVDSLYRTADLVVEATIGAPQVRRLKPNTAITDPRLNPNAGTGVQPADESLVVTVAPARITHVYKGAAKAGDTVEVKQLGGQLEGVTYRAEGVSLLRSTSTYLLFLAVYPDSPASLLNPAQAQYPLNAAGKPTSLTGNRLTVTAGDLVRLSR